MTRKKKKSGGLVVAAVLLLAAALLYARRGKPAAPVVTTGVELPPSVSVVAAPAEPPLETIQRSGTRQAVLNLPPLKVAGVGGRGRRKAAEPPSPK